MMDIDISPLLHEWDYDPEKNVRIIKINPIRQVIQIRKPLGIEQYELDGRPDGKKPFGRGSVLEEIQDRIRRNKQVTEGKKNFVITHDDFLLLQYEAVLNYYRYLVLFQIGDYERTVRDTGDNLKICGLLENYCHDEADRENLLQYKPFILRINAISRAMINIKQDLPDLAQKIIETAIAKIQGLKEIKNASFQYEKRRSISYLKATLAEIKQKPLTLTEKLKLELEDAVEIEDYERAAELRDKLQQIARQGQGK